MLNWDFEIVTCSSFVNCALWSCDINSTLGSVVPLALFLVRFAHHVPLQVEGRIECFRAFTTQYLSDTLTLFSLTKMPKPAADFTFLTWFSCDGFFSCVFTCLSIQTLIWILFHIFHNPETFSPCQAFLRAPACCVWWHVTCVHFRTDTFHICAFFPGF